MSAASKQPASEVDNDTIEARYIYDELGNRMLGIDDNQILKKYQYDNKGRLTTITPIAPTADSANINAQSITYDTAGLPTEYGDYQLSYSAGQLSQVKDKSGKLVAEYTYNDEGQRLKKTVYQKDNKLLATPKTRYYVYEDSQLQHELDSEGNISRHYVYIGNTLTATLDYPTEQHGEVLSSDQSDISLWTRGKNWLGSLWTQESAYPTINYVITDYLGRPRQVRDGETNALKWQFTPTAFGGHVDTSINVNKSDSSYELNVRFPGQYEDTETGLYYNHWRYYDQDTGRYLSADPLGLGGGENLYAYVNATPTHFIDPPGLLLFAFDGTGNNDNGNEQSKSNVVKFRDAYRADVNEPRMFDKDKGITKLTKQNKKFGAFAANNAFYISGAATTDPYTGEKGDSTDGGFGLSIVRRVNTMIGYLEQYLSKVDKQYKGNKKPITVDLDVVGFSRGATSARMFASKVERLISGTDKTYTAYRQNGRIGKDWINTPWKYNQAWLTSSCGLKVNFNFMGLWDTVPAYGEDTSNDVAEMKALNMSLSIPDKFKKVVHAVAVNEHRAQFHGYSIFDKASEAVNTNKRTELGFLGAHSDIGGAYREGDLSDIALMWVIQEAGKAGIDFNEKLIKEKGWDNVTRPIVHDSIGVKRGGSIGGVGLINFSPGREFRWAGTDARGAQQFANFNHLKLDWNETLKFQPTYKTGNKNFRRNKFQQIQGLTQEYLEDESIGCGYVLNACDQTNDIMALKTIDGEKNRTIVYDGSNSKETIEIKDYIQWLQNKGYGLSNLKVNGATVKK